jgi:hypothetical protein
MTMGNAESLRDALRTSAVFGGLGPEAAEALTVGMCPIVVRAGEVLFSSDDPVDALFLLLSGRAGRRSGTCTRCQPPNIAAVVRTGRPATPASIAGLDANPAGGGDAR